MNTLAAPVTVEALPAAYGDAVLVTCALKAKPWRLLVDTGTDECWPSLKQRLAQIPAQRGKRHIDLAVITHIDHDHIGAAHALFDDRSLGLAFGDVWFNAPAQHVARGVAEGRSLATLLGAQHAELPWNKAWGGQQAVTKAASPFIELPGAKGTPRITLLSPTPATLATLLRVWDKELRRLGQSEKPPTKPASMRGATMSLEDLAARPTAVDRAPANGSSIALLLEHQGVSVLLGADAYAPVLADALRALAKHRGVSLPWQLDAFKLSHHGSSANITADLFGVVQARHYIVSTNGAIFGHPDDEAIARVIVHGGAGRNICFNYRNGHSTKWEAPALQARYGYSVRLPTAGRSGITIQLANKHFPTSVAAKTQRG